MDKLPVGQLPDLQQSNNDDEIMVITNSEYNQLKKEKISDLITDFTSTNENNALTKGTDGKMFVTDFGNASNITEGTLPTSVLPEIPLEKIPDIPKDKLPPIEPSDLPVSGVTADTYAYPSSVTVNAQGQVMAIEEGTPSGANANTDLSNITDVGKDVIRNTINVGQILEALTDKLDKNHSNDTKPYIVEQYQNPNEGTAAGNAGYRKWSNGMMEQWASFDNIGPDSKTTISFLIPFSRNVCVYAQQITGGHISSAGTWSVNATTSNYFELINYTDVISSVYWFAIGPYQK